jgi:hypothetical protein
MLKKSLKEAWIYFLLPVLGIVFLLLPGVLVEPFCATKAELGCRACSPLIPLWMCACFHFLVCGLLPKVGEAMFIALFLALSVDTHLKKRIVKEVSAFIRGSHLPVEIRQEIDYVVRTELYRSDYEQSFEIVDDHPVADKLITLKRTYSYFMNNPGSSDQQYEFVSRVSVPPGRTAKMAKVGASGILNVNGGIGDFEAPDPATKEENGVMEWKHVCVIPANSTARARFWVETLQTLSDHDEMTSYTREATVRYRITMKYPNDFEVSVNFGYHDRDAIRKLPKQRPTSWTLSGALLPMAAVTISWTRLRGDIAPIPAPKASILANLRKLLSGHLFQGESRGSSRRT